MLKVFILVVLIKFSSPDKFLGQPAQCAPNIVDKILTNYFKKVNCVTIIDLTEKNQYHFLAYKPKFLKKINATNIKATNLTYRPRRDIFDQNGSVTKFCPENGQGFLFLLTSINDLRNYISTTISTPFWSPQALFFFFSPTQLLEENALNVSTILFKIYKTPHLVFMSCDQNLIFFHPFLKQNGKWGKVSKYNYEEVLKNPNLAYNNLWNFNGYPLVQVIFQSPLTVPENGGKYSGLDVDMLKVIAKYANFTSVVIEPFDALQYGFKLPDGTFTGALKRLLDGDADYINVNYFITDYLTSDIEFSAGTMSDSVCLIMKKAEKIPDWQLLYFCFDYRIWISLVIVYFVMSFSWIVIQKLLRTFNDAAVVYPYVFLDTFRLMIASSLFRLPSIASEMVFLGTCLIAFVTIIGAFQGSLVGVFSAQLFYSDLDTLEDISWSETKIKTPFLFLTGELFSDVTNPKILRLKNLLSFYNDSVPTVQRVARQKFFATLVRRSEFDLDKATTTYFDEQGNNLIHMVKECAKTYNMAYPLPVNSYLAPRLNELLLRAAQAGLPVKWYSEIAFEVSRRKRQSSVTDGFKVFGLNDMQIAFYILVIGYIISVIAFVLEFFESICRKWRHKKIRLYYE